MAVGDPSRRFLRPAVGRVFIRCVIHRDGFNLPPALFLSELSNDQSILILKRQLDSPFFLIAL